MAQPPSRRVEDGDGGGDADHGDLAEALDADRVQQGVSGGSTSLRSRSWLAAVVGLATRPQSATETTRGTRMRRVVGSIRTSTKCATKLKATTSGQRGRAGDEPDDGVSDQSPAFQRVVREVLEAQRRTLLDLRARGVIGNEALDRLYRDLDLEDSRLEI